MGNGLKRLSKAHQDLVLAIAQQLNDRDALAARVGGEAVMRSLPHGEQPFANDQMRTAAASLAGANQRHNNVDLLPLLKYVLVDTTCTFRYNVFGTPNCRADTHALLTCTALRMILGEHAGDDDDDDALWHRVFSANEIAFFERTPEEPGSCRICRRQRTVGALRLCISISTC
jgi:hypothetical protein